MGHELIDEKAVFSSARQIAEPAERLAHVQEACGHDSALLQRVLELLRVYDQDRSFLEDSPIACGQVISERVSEAPGMLIGPYKLLEQIGEGGFAVVFMAEQSYPVRRKVALKVLKPGMDTRQVVARFEAERQALALMDHPHIARILDAGTTNTGRPYFVMDLVRGVPITEFCDQSQLPLTDRLELFVSVCQAVQHAHHKGIIHRDIKPTNVLVTLHDGTPVPIVIDFGIAKAMGQQLTDRTLFTNFAQMVGTPLYMSPEQVALSGLDVDTRSDIYSLGVLLYELLTSTTPFPKEQFKAAEYDEIRRIIREEEPPKPSTRLSDSKDTLPSISAQRHTELTKLTRLVRGELDWIVMKALEKDRTRRYETASAFAADVERYVADEPVHACPPSAAYRLRKFARRNKRALATAAAASLLIVSMGIGAGWVMRDRQAREQEVARDRAARAAALNEVTNRAVNEARSLIQQGRWPDAVAVVERIEKLLLTAGREPKDFAPVLQELDKDLAMAQRLEEIHSEPGREGAPRVERVGVPGAQLLAQSGSQAINETGHVFRSAEMPAAYDRAFRDFGIDVMALPTADAARRICARSIPRELARALDLWSSIRKRAAQGPEWRHLLEVAKAADPDPWCNQLRDAVLSGNRKSLEELAASTHVARISPANLHMLGSALYEVGAPQLAISLLGQAREHFPSDLWLNDALATYSYNARQYDDAVRFFTACQAIRPRNPYTPFWIGRSLEAKEAHLAAIGEFTRAIELKPDLVDAWRSRGFAHASLKQWQRAIADYDMALEMDPDDGGTHLRRGEALAGQGKLELAIAAYRKAIKFDPNNDFPHYKLGRTLKAVGDLNGALREFRRSWELNPDGWGARSELFRAFTRQARFREFEDVRVVWRRRLDLFPARHETWYGYAEFCLYLGLEDEYRRHRGELLAHFGNTTDPAIAERVARACLLLPASAHELEQAAALAERALAAGPKDSFYGYFLAVKGLSEYRLGRFDSAIGWLEQSESCGIRMPVTELVLAMARKRSGLTQHARETLNAALRSFRWSSTVESYPDEFIAHVLRREAEPLVLVNLSAFLDGKYEPHDSEERLEFLEACRFRKHFRTVARLYADLFAAEPGLAEDLRAVHRFRAACAAVLAGAGQGRDADNSQEDERMGLRKQALEWLRAELAMYATRWRGSNAQDRDFMQKQLEHWQRDDALISIRDPAALSKLPAGELASCARLWTEVAALLRKMRGQQK